jgi:hypothetical protein
MTGHSQPLVTAWMYSQEMHFVGMAPVTAPTASSTTPIDTAGSFAPDTTVSASPTSGGGAVLEVESSPRQLFQFRRGVADSETPPSVPTDPFNNTFASAHNLGRIVCGGSMTVQGTTSPAGSEDWFVVSFVENCPLQVALTADPGIKFDIVSAGVLTLQPGRASAQVSSPNPFWIRVYGAPEVTGSWKLQISNP